MYIQILGSWKDVGLQVGIIECVLLEALFLLMVIYSCNRSYLCNSIFNKLLSSWCLKFKVILDTYKYPKSTLL